MNKSFALPGLLVVLTSCATIGERMPALKPGMNKPEVVQILGKPWTAGGVTRVEVLHYKEDGYYFVRLVDDKVADQKMTHLSRSTICSSAVLALPEFLRLAPFLRPARSSRRFMCRSAGGARGQESVW
jgi:ribosomal protein S28E/S33